MATTKQIVNGELVISNTNSLSKLEVLRRASELNERIQELQGHIDELNVRLDKLKTARNELLAFAAQM